MNKICRNFEGMDQLFYSTDIDNGLIRLDEEESRHLITVLRRKVGDHLQITDGLGHIYHAILVEITKRQAIARIETTSYSAAPRKSRLHIAIAPVKNIERIEWFLEKATEIGIDEITPILCDRSTRDNIRHDRLQKVVVSAMKQSLQSHLPTLHTLTPFKKMIGQARETNRILPWCADDPPPHLKSLLVPEQDTLICIGPEGDFSPEEVAWARGNGFKEASLGATRLRTETAALYCVTAFGLAGL